MIYGYARVSSNGQKLDVQIKALKEYGVEKIFKEKASGREMDNRKQFQKLLDTVQEGDKIVFTKLDRFARSTKDALNTLDELKEKGVSVVILNMGGDTLDTSSPIGKMLLTVMFGIAEFEADISKERQREGIELAKNRGIYKGRPKTYGKHHKGLDHALKLFYERDKNKMTVNEIEQITKVSRATIYREAKKLEKRFTK